MTEKIREFRRKEAESYPKSIAEYPAWLIAKYGMPGLLAALVIPVWISKEKQTDLFIDQSKANIEALNALTKKIEDSEKTSEMGREHMKEVTSAMLQELKAIREQQLRQSGTNATSMSAQPTRTP